MIRERAPLLRPGLARRAPLAGAVGGLLALLFAAAVAADSPAPAGSAGSGGSPAPAGSAGANAISIIDKTFQPSTLTVNAGDTVTWTVTKAISDPHSVTSGSYKDTANAGKVFDSGIKLENNGDSFSYLFATAGTFSFFCSVHPDTMSGTITVVAAGGESGAGGGEGPIPTSTKAIAAGILIVALVLFFGWARVYRKMNPGP
jgi:plastocyanin